eukprot:CAMPEP_0198288916 /NCGR_PEP_ID=MMETSP1449-20131203/7276_1 /TAXON_ID=420275 /ORGANISM="Attheya septentrionalis, Strain CCMP2084" /LENGTH=944 /DNA_ID=CAMNT_0043987155 /DNA_START=308 /DNA_END=3142 /DNA_ORIENTATION=-
MAKPAKVWQISHKSNPKGKSSMGTANQDGGELMDLIPVTISAKRGQPKDKKDKKKVSRDETRSEEDEKRRVVGGKVGWLNPVKPQPYDIHAEESARKFDSESVSSTYSSITYDVKSNPKRQAVDGNNASATFEDEPQELTLPNDKIQFKKKAQPLMMLKTRLSAGKKKDLTTTNRSNGRSSAWDVDPEIEDSTIHTWGDDTTQTSGYTENTYTTETRTLDSGENGNEETEESLSLLYELAITLKETVSGELDDLGRQVKDGRNKANDAPSTIEEESQDWCDGSINGSKFSNTLDEAQAQNKIENPDWDSGSQYEIVDHKIDAIQQFRSTDQADGDWCNGKKEEELDIKDPDVDIQSAGIKKLSVSFSMDIERTEDDSFEDDSVDEDKSMADESQKDETTQPQMERTAEPTKAQSCFEQIASFFGGSCCAADTTVDNSPIVSVSSKKKEESLTHFAIPRKQVEENDMPLNSSPPLKADKSQAKDTEIQESYSDQEKEAQAIAMPDIRMISPCGSLDDIYEGSDIMNFPSTNNFMLPTHQKSTIIEVEHLENDVEADDSTVAAGASARAKHANEERFSPPCEVIVEEAEDDNETFNDMMSSYYDSLDPNIKPSSDQKEVSKTDEDDMESWYASLDPTIKPSSDQKEDLKTDEDDMESWYASLDPIVNPSSGPKKDSKSVEVAVAKSYVWQICDGKLVRVEKEAVESDVKPNTKKGKTKSEKDAKGEVPVSSFKTDMNKGRTKNTTTKFETSPSGMKKEARSRVTVSSFKSDVNKGKSKNTVTFETSPRVVKEEPRYRPNRSQRTVSYVKPKTRPIKQSSTRSVNNMSPSISTTRRKEFKGSIARETDKAMSDAIEQRIRSGMKEDREDVSERHRRSTTRSGPKKTAVSRGKDPTEAVPEDLFAAKLAQLQRETSQQLSATRKLVAETHAQTELWTPKSMRNRSKCL